MVDSALPTPRVSPQHSLHELDELHRLIQAGGDHLHARLEGEVQVGELTFPIHVITLGSANLAHPAVGFFGGVHGLERIGAEVVLAYLGGLVHRLSWDGLLHEMLQRVRLVFMPLVNPGGLWRGTRANPGGVDLMRNAPVEAAAPVPFLIGGQRMSAALPWYRGPAAGGMEIESAALCAVVERELLARPFSIALDCHSGFGLQDRIWFPFAHSCEPIEHLPELHALQDIFSHAHSHHRYVFEPQSQQYLAHGDLWDHLYLQALKRTGSPVFLPLTLEMGSWLWVKKNPRQLFSRHGIFNPLIRHRQERVLRRHTALLDFLARAAASHDAWAPSGSARGAHRALALRRWYGVDDATPVAEHTP